MKLLLRKIVEASQILYGSAGAGVRGKLLVVYLLTIAA